MSAIFRRRSIREYKKDYEITEETLKDLLMAAMAAPTARNGQEWEFVVVKSPEGKATIVENHPFAKMVQNASVAIIVCFDKDKELAPGYGVEDGAAALQNILIRATELNLGSCWLGVYPNEERIEKIAKSFQMPPNIIPMGIAVVGKAIEEKEANKAYFEEKVHYETY